MPPTDLDGGLGPWMDERQKTWLWVLAAAALTVLLVVSLWGRFPGALAGREEQARLVHGLLLLAFLGASAILHRRIRPGQTLGNVVVWVAVGVVLFAGYGYRHELSQVTDRLMGELIPHRGIEVAGGAVSVRADASGHFVVEAVADGVRVAFLVDTGASDVVLAPADAERLGFDPEKLAYTRTYRTANGIVQGAPVRLGRIDIGPISVMDVNASVNGAPMKRSLLGMSFLNRLSGYDVSRETLTLRP